VTEAKGSSASAKRERTLGRGNPCGVTAPRNAQGGFTLVEMMVALVMFSFAVAGVLAVAVSMTQGFRENRLASAEEQSARLPLDFLTDALRQVAPGVSDPTQVHDADTCTDGAITIGNGAGLNSSDTLDIIYALGGIVTTVQTAYSGGTTLNVIDASSFAAGDRVLLSNLSQGHLMTIQSISGNVITLKTLCGGVNLNGGYPAGSLVIRAQHAKFEIKLVDNIPALTMDPDATGAANSEPIADGVEDFQVAVGIDGSTDGLTENTVNGTGDEWYYNAASESLPASGTYRAVRVTLVARSVGALVGAGTVSTRPAIEDHSVGTADNYRRRVLRSTVEIRNTGVSP
jgi:prepilin-type N-terminal cleavage/methylation domain-containing protein